MSKKIKCAIGVDLGGTNIKVGIVSSEGKTIKKTSLITEAEKGPDNVINQIKKGIYSILSGNEIRLKGIGIGAPGVVTLETGTVQNPPNFPGWEKIELGKIIKKEFGFPVHVENDANAAAVGELIFGAGQKYDSFVMVTLGTGVGGGVIMDKKLFRGEFGAAGEIGHITIDFNGPKCNCGSFGCIEAYIGNQYLVNSIKNELPAHPNSLINELIEQDYINLTPKIIDMAAQRGDEYAVSVIKNVGRYLGAALASVSNLLDISTFIIGGGVAGFGKPLFDEVVKTASSRVLKPLQNRVKVLPARLKNDAGIKGASALVYYITG
ncbi:MAG TPA: ROK family protein [Ignavibacteriaceae bacterium]|nr:ROK family protein [Ignavibacteriaceae bacterium]